MKKRAVETGNAPSPIGPYSQAVIAGDFIFASGQTPLNPETGELIDGDIGEQTAQALRNLSAVLEAAGSDIGQVLKTTVYLADMNDFAAMNEAYGRFFTQEPPARTTIQAARLPRDARVEIELVALAANALK
ncbi:MAG TPA: RidA family protein [Pyrinomonadaceae bacterium]|nr:RidA family protein [Pyrinomonadaceae bacterium]